MSSLGKRTTQRAPKSCIQCSKRKLRCSKVIPCSNCVDRGLERACHREDVLLTGANQRPQPRNIGRLRHRRSSPICERRPPSSSASSQTLLPPPIDGPSAGGSQDEATSGTGISGIAMPSSKANTHKDGCTTSTQDENDLAIEAAMSLESLAWGSFRQERTSSGLSSRVLTIMSQLHALADRNAARKILSFHQSSVAWMHNVVYMPFFVRRCEAYLGGRLHQDVAWLSLYAATLCAGVYYMTNAQHSRLGMNDGYEVARKTYDITLELIKESDFMAVQSIHSVQAICILVLCSHSFGDGKRIKTLLACANTIAQNEPHKLHLHQRQQQQPVPFQRLVDAEVRKRIWCFLSTQDWYLIGSRNAYSINPSHGDANQPPFNSCEDFDDKTTQGQFRDVPLSCPTQSTYTICLFRIADQRRQLFDGLRAISWSSSSPSFSDAEAFDAVLEADSHWENTTSTMVKNAMSSWNCTSASSPLSTPSSSLPVDSPDTRGKVQERYDKNQEHHHQLVPSMRRALIIASWHQRLFIHRPFFCRAFQDKRYHYSRSASLAAARAILRCFLLDDEVGSPVAAAAEVEIWTVPAHAISACLVITLETVFSADGRGTTTREEKKSDEDLMRRGLEVLQNGNEKGMGHRRPSAIVDRGLLIIGKLLGGQQHHQSNGGDRAVRGVDQIGGVSVSGSRRFKKLDPGEISVLAREIGDAGTTDVGSTGTSGGGGGSYYYYHDQRQRDGSEMMMSYQPAGGPPTSLANIITTATTTAHQQQGDSEGERMHPLGLVNASNSNNGPYQDQQQHHHQHNSATTSLLSPPSPFTGEIQRDNHDDHVVQDGQQQDMPWVEDDFCMAYLNDPVFQDVFRW